MKNEPNVYPQSYWEDSIKEFFDNLWMFPKQKPIVTPYIFEVSKQKDQSKKKAKTTTSKTTKDKKPSKRSQKK